MKINPNCKICDKNGYIKVPHIFNVEKTINVPHLCYPNELEEVSKSEYENLIEKKLYEQKIKELYEKR